MKQKIISIAFLQLYLLSVAAQNDEVTLDRLNHEADPLGETASFRLEAPIGMRWEASSSASWVKLPVASRSGVGSKVISYSIDRNVSLDSRTADIIIDFFVEPFSEQLIGKNSKAKLLVPQDGSLEDQWMNSTQLFDDSDWKVVSQPVGWESPGGTLEDLIVTNISSEMRGINSSGYFRFPFQYNLDKKFPIFSEMTMRVDDGYVAYLNGVEIDRQYSPELLAWNARSRGSRGDATVKEQPFVIDLTPFILEGQDSILLNGENILAIQAMNLSDNGSDFLVDLNVVIESLFAPIFHVINQAIIDPESDIDGDGLIDVIETNTGRYVSINNTGTNPRVADSDGDGLIDSVETNTRDFVDPNNTGTNPNNADTDNDGFSDLVETNTGTFISAEDTGTDPNDRDTDGDGSFDKNEINKGTDPFDPDMDKDGLSDFVETGTGQFVSKRNTGSDPRNPDSDGDGLSDLEEVENTNTNPNKLDSDDDGLSDLVETGTGIFVDLQNTGTDPNDKDTDNDGLSDLVETNSGSYISNDDTGTNPHLRDTDGDGSSDNSEINLGTDPFDPDMDDDGLLDSVETNTGVFFSNANTGTNPKESDSDGDSFSDFEEVQNGVNPNNPKLFPFHLTKENYESDRIFTFSEFGVGASEGVEWLARSLSPWLSIEGVNFSTGSENVSYSIDRNESGENRMGKILVVEGKWNDREIVTNQFNKLFIPSLAYSPIGLPSIAFHDYLDTDNSLLRYAEYDGQEWVIEVVDDSSSAIGYWPNHFYDTEGNPIISYYDSSNSSIKFARKIGSEWKTETVIGNNSNVAWRPSLSLSLDGRPAIAYVEFVNGEISNLRYAIKNDTKWIFESVDSTGDFIFPQLSFGEDGYPRIVYKNQATGTLKYAEYDGERWLFENVPTGNDNIIRPSLSVSPSGEVFIAYCNDISETRGQVKVVSKSSDRWKVILVREGNPRWDTKIFHGPDGLPSLVFSDYDGGQLEFAKYDGNDWNIKEVDSQVQAAFPSLNYKSEGMPSIAYYDYSNDQLIYRDWDYFGTEEENVLIFTDSEVKFFLPKDDSLGDIWKGSKSSFNDSLWATLTSPVGFETPGGPIEKYINTSIEEEMRGVNSSAYFRYTFRHNSDLSLIRSATLSVTADDGFVAYLNGVEVSRNHAPSNLSWNSKATSSVQDTFLVSNPIITNIGLSELIVDGENVLAVHGLNLSRGSADFFLDVELKIREKTPNAFKYHSVTQTTQIDPTKDSDNDGLPDIVETNTGKFVSHLDTGTDPRKPDTDGDGLTDSVESNTGIFISENDTGSNPHWIDSDEDTLSDLLELINGTNPNKNDSDGDGLGDLEETNTGIFVSLNDTGTDPVKSDSDGDGLIDSYEIGIGRFSIVSGFFDWESAREDALSKGGDLGTLSNKLEWESAFKSIGGIESLKNFTGIWIGASDAENEGDWRWVDGDRIRINEWAEGEPDNFLEADVAELGGGLSSSPGTIFDVPAKLIRGGYLLEIGSSSNPLNSDSDGDSYTDKEEIDFFSDPLNPESIPYVSLVLNIEGEGIVEGAGLYPLNTEVTVAATPAKDYKFGGWTGDAINDVSSFNLLMDGNKILKSNFIDSMQDDDNDGLSNLAERISYNTNPQSFDSDGDGLSDGDEILRMSTNPNDEDTDKDGLFDGVESGTLRFVSNDDTGTDPNNSDTDGDGLLDGCELEGYSTYSIVKGKFNWDQAIQDAENRGGHLASFADELEWEVAIADLGNKPYDGYGYVWIGAEKKEDKWEWITGEEFKFNLWANGQSSNRTKAMLVGNDARGKLPGSWVTNSASARSQGYFFESIEKFNPVIPDTDGDGFLDSEAKGVVCDTDNNLFANDIDKDGWEDATEIFFGSSTEDASSVPVFDLKINTNNQGEVEVLFPAQRLNRYTIQYSVDFKNWVSLKKLIIGQGKTATHKFILDNEMKFIRIKKE